MPQENKGKRGEIRGKTLGPEKAKLGTRRSKPGGKKVFWAGKTSSTPKGKDGGR
jgi:hypothetical protein